MYLCKVFSIFSIIRKSPGNSGWSQNRHPRVKMNNSIVNAFFSCRKPHRGIGSNNTHRAIKIYRKPHRRIGSYVNPTYDRPGSKFALIFRHQFTGGYLRKNFVFCVFISFYIPPLGLWESMADATLSIEAKCFPGLTACSTGRKR